MAKKRALVPGISGFCVLTDIPKREEKRGGSLLERHETGTLTRARYLPAQVRSSQSLSDSLSRSLSTPSATTAEPRATPGGTALPPGLSVLLVRSPRRAARMLREGGGGAGAGRGAVAPRRGS